MLSYQRTDRRRRAVAAKPWSVRFVRSDAHATTAGLVLGTVVDRLVGDPRRLHPVAGYGSLVTEWERLIFARSTVRGGAFTGLALLGPLAGGLLLDRLTRGRPVLRTVAVAAGTWTVLGGTTLARTGAAMADRLETAGDDGLEQARQLLPHLCGRDPEPLDRSGLARASVESIAENTSDAAVGALVWGGLAGLPGMLVFRAANTLDAMVGHRTERYERFGKVSARTDDLLGWLPARVTAAFTVLCAPFVGGTPSGAWRTWRRDAGRHPSPNAGRCEASAAGALGVRLGGRTAYRHAVEERPEMGDGAAPTADDLRRAVRLSESVNVTVLAAVVAARLIMAAAKTCRRGSR